MYPRANQSPQSISLTTKKRSAQGIAPSHGRKGTRSSGRVAAKGLLSSRQFSIFSHSCDSRRPQVDQTPTCDGTRVKCGRLVDLWPPPMEANLQFEDYQTNYTKDKHNFLNRKKFKILLAAAASRENVKFRKFEQRNKRTNNFIYSNTT